MGLGAILVPYDGSEPADALLRLACHTIDPGGRVLVLAMTRVPASLPLDPLPCWFDTEGNAALDRAEAVAGNLGVPIETWLLRIRHPVAAIVDEARIQEVDAVFLPLWAWRYPLRRFRASRTARALARQLSCAVLLGNWMPGTGQSLAAAAATASPYQPVATGPTSA